MTASTSVDTKKPLLKNSYGDDIDVHLYRSMIGSLMYLTSSRPDIMFAVCACARFQVTPKVSHSHAVKRIFRYLKGQPKLGLWYPRNSPFDLVAYSDSDYVGASLDRKSTTGGCQLWLLPLIWVQINIMAVQEANYGLLVILKTAKHIEYLCVMNQTPRQGQDTKIPQSSGPPEKVGDEAIHKELGDRMERAATTASSLEAEQDSDSGLKCQDTKFRGVDAQTSHNMVAYLLKPEGSEDFHEILDFLSTSHIKTSENGEMKITATIDGRVKTATEPSIRRHLKLEDSDGISSLPNTKIFEQLALMGVKDQQSKVTPITQPLVVVGNKSSSRVNTAQIRMQ
ncbi:hypothetical protein Tco_1357512 [Tanacetum coccineum]